MMMPGYFSHAGRSRAFQRLAGLLSLLLVLFALTPSNARADCTYDKISGNKYYTSTPVNFTITSSVTIPFTLSTGAVLVSSGQTTPTNPPVVTCTGGTPYGVQNLVGGAPTGGSNYIYPTSVAGVGYQLIHANSTSTFMSPYPANSATAGDSTYSVATSLQFVQTGPIANGSSLAAGTVLANWQWGTIVPETFVLANTVTFVTPACTVTTNPINVTLPSVSTSALAGGAGTTAGTTAFNIQLNCPTGATSKLSITLASNSGTPTGLPNILQNTGTATGVGIQLLNPNPIVLGTATVLGTAVSGPQSYPYYARYYSTTGAVVAGSVKASATFTLTYQ